ncbi:MAG TPA: L,D-transpeptidase [Solirubrobacteraceae bacterium]|nr:L,D-transpeptidase [Solirubrobacteraceae bacterium]
MRACWVAILVLMLPAGASAQVPVPPAPPAEPIIPIGAAAAGLDIGGLTLTAAAAKLQHAFADRLKAPIQTRVAGRRVRLYPADIALVFDARKTARRANIAAKATPPAPDGGRYVDVPLHVTYDRAALNGFTAMVDRRSQVIPRNARLRMTVRRMHLRRARMGWSIDERALTAQLDPVLADPHAERIVRAERERVPPAINANDLRHQYRVVVTVDRKHFKLRYFKNLKRRKSYGVAVGMPGHATPRGRFAIVNKAVNPDWTAPDEPWAGAYRNEVVEGGAPDNPLKARWLGIVNGVGIHGTDADWSIGTRASHGCIRMHVPDVIDLYPRVPVGSTVLIR